MRHIGTWYDLTPAEYAASLRYGADRSDECAVRGYQDQADHYRRQARALRAMALLCDRSSVETAGDVDFMGLDSPRQGFEASDTVMTAIESAR